MSFKTIFVGFNVAFWWFGVLSEDQEKHCRFHQYYLVGLLGTQARQQGVHVCSIAFMTSNYLNVNWFPLLGYGSYGAGGAGGRIAIYFSDYSFVGQLKSRGGASVTTSPGQREPSTVSPSLSPQGTGASWWTMEECRSKMWAIFCSVCVFSFGHSNVILLIPLFRSQASKLPFLINKNAL